MCTGRAERFREAAKFDAKADALAATIDQMAPDLLAVQEVGDPDALADVLSRIGGTCNRERQRWRAGHPGRDSFAHNTKAGSAF